MQSTVAWRASHSKYRLNQGTEIHRCQSCSMERKGTLAKHLTLLQPKSSSQSSRRRQQQVKSSSVQAKLLGFFLQMKFSRVCKEVLRTGNQQGLRAGSRAPSQGAHGPRRSWNGRLSRKKPRWNGWGNHWALSKARTPWNYYYLYAKPSHFGNK